jgi:hypothetical protein
MGAVLDRRDVLKILTASAAFAGPLQLTAREPDKPLYFTKDEFTLLDRLTELIIPQDAHSPGAHAAGVAAFIDRTVAETFLPEDKQSWNRGLAEVDRLSVENSKRTFLKAAKDQQIALLKKLAQGEQDPKTEGEKFFGQLKNTTVFAYYTTAIGIHQEMEYKGNVIQEQFTGYEVV